MGASEIRLSYQEPEQRMQTQPSDPGSRAAFTELSISLDSGLASPLTTALVEEGSDYGEASFKRRNAQAMLKVSGQKFFATTTSNQFIFLQNAILPIYKRNILEESSEEEEKEDDPSKDEDDGDEGNEEDEKETELEEEEVEEMVGLKEGDTLETAIREQRIRAIAALLGKIEAGQVERPTIPSLQGKDNTGPGGSPLHFAASLPPDCLSRDKVFEYLMNYSLKYRFRKEDEEEGPSCLSENEPDPFRERLMGRRRNQSYLKSKKCSPSSSVGDLGEESAESSSSVTAEAEDDEEHYLPAWKWIDIPDRMGNTALHIAAAQGFLFAVNVLLQDGRVEPDIINARGMSSSVSIDYAHSRPLHPVAGRDTRTYGSPHGMPARLHRCVRGLVNCRRHAGWNGRQGESQSSHGQPPTL